MNRRILRAWCLYDFGNSAFAVLFPFVYGTYYSHIVVGGARGSALWGYAGSLSMLCVALSAPLLGGIADHAGARKRMLLLFTAAGLGAVLGFGAVGPGTIAAGFLLAVAANFAFEGGIVFYNAYLPRIAPPSHHGRVSAYGFATGYVGSLVAIGVAVLLARSLGVAWIWPALALQWGLFALPAFLRLPADRPTGMGLLAAAGRGVKRTLSTWREVARMPDLRRFLLAYFFYMDGVNTVIWFAGVFAQEVFHFSTAELLGLIAVVQVTALLGSLALAAPTDRKGPRWAVRRTLLWWIGVVVAAYLVRSRALFWVVAVLAGLGLGSIQAASRALMSRLIPKGREAEMFGFYALCGKTGAILGPALFGSVALWFNDQRPAVLPLAGLYLLGFFLLGRVNVR